MQSILKVIGVIASADALVKTFGLLNVLSDKAEALADRLEMFEKELKENENEISM